MSRLNSPIMLGDAYISIHCEGQRSNVKSQGQTVQVSTLCSEARLTQFFYNRLILVLSAQWMCSLTTFRVTLTLKINRVENVGRDSSAGQHP